MAVSLRTLWYDAQLLITFLEASRNPRRKYLYQNMILRCATTNPLQLRLADTLAKCYLCPGNKRAQGDTNPQYKSTFVFVNDYSAVKEEQAGYEPEESGGISGMLPLRTCKN
jgi:galactose-1-phosphate uridylyltransferase